MVGLNWGGLLTEGAQVPPPGVPEPRAIDRRSALVARYVVMRLQLGVS